MIVSVPPIPAWDVTTAWTPDPVAPSEFTNNKSPGAYPDPPFWILTLLAVTTLLATVTFAVAPWPSPVRVVNWTPVYVPSVNPIPVFDTMVNLLVPVANGPPVLNTLPVCPPVCCISSFGVITVVIGLANLIETLFENPTTGFDFLILPRGNLLL